MSSDNYYSQCGRRGRIASCRKSSGHEGECGFCDGISWRSTEDGRPLAVDEFAEWIAREEDAAWAVREGAPSNLAGPDPHTPQRSKETP